MRISSLFLIRLFFEVIEAPRHILRTHRRHQDAHGRLLRADLVETDPPEHFVYPLPVGVVLMYVSVSQVALADTRLLVSQQLL